MPTTQRILSAATLLLTCFPFALFAAKPASDAKGPAGAVRESKRSVDTTIRQMLEEMTTELKLTTQQQDAIKAIFEESADKMQHVRTDRSITNEEQRMAMIRDVLRETRAKLAGQMSDEQTKRFVNMTFKKIARGEN